MNNKKFFIIVIAVLLLILLGIVLCFKFNVSSNTEENMPGIEAVQETVETPSESEDGTIIETDESNALENVKPTAKHAVKPITVKENVDTKADENAVNELKEIEKITEKSEPSNIVVIDKEYKMKSKDKYTFK